MKRIETVTEAFQACGLDPNARPDVSSFPAELQKYMLNHYELLIITKALNKLEDGTFWEPDWSNWDQYKYFPWVEVKASKENPSGFGFSSSFYVLWHSLTFAGSRLCFHSSELALYALKQFEEHYKINLLILK